MFFRNRKKTLLLTGLVTILFILIMSPINSTAEEYTLLLSWGEPGTGPGQFAQWSPYGVMVDDATGNVYAADCYNDRIQVFTDSGTFIKYIGVGDLSLPIDSAIDNEGNLFVSDYGNQRVVKYDSTGVMIASTADTRGSFGTGPYQFHNPLGIDVDNDGNVYVADWYNGRVQKYTNDMVYVTDFGVAKFFGPNPPEPGDIWSARDVAVDDNSGRVYITDSANFVHVFDLDGNFLYRMTNISTNGIAVDDSGDLYANGKKYSPTGELIETLIPYGSGGSLGHWNDVDKCKNWWVVDARNQGVMKFGTGEDCNYGSCACEGDLAICEDNLANCDDDLAVCDEELANCDADLVACDDNLANCSDNLATCEGDLNTCNDDLSIANEEITNLTTQLEDANAEISDLTTQLENANNEITNLTNRLTAAEQAIADLAASLEAMFSEPGFSVPGDSPEEQIDNLVDAIGELNYGQQQALFENLGGTKGKGKGKGK